MVYYLFFLKVHALVVSVEEIKSKRFLYNYHYKVNNIDYKMNERKFMDYVTDQVVSRIRPLTPEPQLKLLISAHPDQRKFSSQEIGDDKYAYGVRSGMELVIGNFLYSIIWGVERIGPAQPETRMPSIEEVLKEFNSTGSLPSKVKTIYGYIIFEGDEEFGEYIIETEDLATISRIEGRHPKAGSVPVQKNQKLEEGVGPFLEFIVKNYIAQQDQT